MNLHRRIKSDDISGKNRTYFISVISGSLLYNIDKSKEEKKTDRTVGNGKS